jgi:hypothetical protein
VVVSNCFSQIKSPVHIDKLRKVVNVSASHATARKNTFPLRYRGCDTPPFGDRLVSVESKVGASGQRVFERAFSAAVTYDHRLDWADIRGEWEHIECWRHVPVAIIKNEGVVLFVIVSVFDPATTGHESGFTDAHWRSFTPPTALKNMPIQCLDIVLGRRERGKRVNFSE